MPDKLNYADFWLRFIAGLIDLVIVVVVSTVLSWIIPVLGDLIKVLLPLGYFIYFESSAKQATIGKQFVNIKVVDLKGNRITSSTALIRTISKILSLIIVGFGFIMIAFTEKNRGLHDIIAETLVIQNAATDQDKIQKVKLETEDLKNTYPDPIVAEAE
jgi:uncharacterized RDD family membrane protein YckC